ncbi:hypothetical protein [Anaerosporobacter sp.]
MKEVALVYEDCIKISNYGRFIRFLSSITDKVTYLIVLSNYTHIQDEYDQIISDLEKEYKLENSQRRLRFEQDLEFRKSLLDMYRTEEEVLSYFDRYELYDSADFEAVKQKIQYYITNSEVPFPDTNIRNKTNLPQISFLDSKFTMYSDCYVGGLYKIYNLKMDESMINYLLYEGDLTKVASFRNVEWIEDPSFYKNNRLVCSVCSHEYIITLSLEDKDYKEFKTLGIREW